MNFRRNGQLVFLVWQRPSSLMWDDRLYSSNYLGVKLFLGVSLEFRFLLMPYL